MMRITGPSGLDIRLPKGQSEDEFGHGPKLIDMGFSRWTLTKHSNSDVIARDLRSCSPQADYMSRSSQTVSLQRLYARYFGGSQGRP